MPKAGTLVLRALEMEALDYRFVRRYLERAIRYLLFLRYGSTWGKTG